MKDICKNCGGHNDLHQYGTNRCPRGGMEAPIGHRQEWMDTTFERQNNDAATIVAQAARIKELESALKYISEFDTIRPLAGVDAKHLIRIAKNVLEPK